MPGLRGEQLIDGYSEIAHAILAGPGAPPAVSVQQQVAAMLADHWGMAPAEARAQARDIMSFWDERTGVFVASRPGGDIEPRSRVFAETGDAMWVANQNPTTRREWITTSLTDDDHREAVLLAAGISPAVITDLLQSATRETDATARSRALEWAADAVAESPEAAVASLDVLIRELAQAAREAAANPGMGTEPSRDTSAPCHVAAAPPEWRYVYRIALLPLPTALRPAGKLADDDGSLKRAVAGAPRAAPGRRPR
jgi:hypothetical protein